MIRKIFLRLWNSATFTEWGPRVIQPLRLLLVTPLIITKFTETEIAAWYLFSSINFLGLIITGRVGLTLSRMVSMARGGAVDLKPVAKALARAQAGEANWDGILRVYRCMAVTQLIVVFLTVLAAGLIGWYTLTNVVEGKPEAGSVILAFVILQGSTLLFGAFGHFPVMLRGLGHVALVNRWATLSSLLSALSGFVVLSAGGNIVLLVSVMQVLTGLVFLRNWWLVRTVNDGRLRGRGSPGWDKEVWGWAWPPLWKGFLGQLASQGVFQISALIFSFYSTTQGLATFLFSMSIMRALQQFAMTPFSSQQPRFSKLMGAGRLSELASAAEKRIVVCLILLAAGALFVGAVGPLALEWIGAKARLLPIELWALLTLVFMNERFNTYSLAVCAVGNNIVLYWRQVATGVLSLILLYLLIPIWGVLGVIAGLAIPPLIVMNVLPARYAARQVGRSTRSWFARTYLPVLMLQVALVAGLFLFGSAEWGK